MKLRHSFILITLLSFFALSPKADEYVAPKFKWKNPKSNDYKVVKEKNFDEFGENSYRVQEEPESQRNVASEEEEEGRGPSSTPDTRPQGPQAWPYK